MKVLTAHTSEADLPALRSLLDDVFGEWLTEDDWDHCLGGIHAIAFDGDAPIGHASVVQRQLTNAGRALRAGYVEGVAVRADHRRRGVATMLMRELEQVIRASYMLGALAATDEGAPFYEALGWKRWAGALAAFTARGIQPTGDEAVYILEVDGELDPAAPLIADFRAGDVW